MSMYAPEEGSETSDQPCRRKDDAAPESPDDEGGDDRHPAQRRQQQDHDRTDQHDQNMTTIGYVTLLGPSARG
jgi:hypothetical protein